MRLDGRVTQHLPVLAPLVKRIKLAVQFDARQLFDGRLLFVAQEHRQVLDLRILAEGQLERLLLAVIHRGAGKAWQEKADQA